MSLIFSPACMRLVEGGEYSEEIILAQLRKDLRLIQGMGKGRIHALTYRLSAWADACPLIMQSPEKFLSEFQSDTSLRGHEYGLEQLLRTQRHMQEMVDSGDTHASGALNYITGVIGDYKFKARWDHDTLINLRTALYTWKEEWERAREK